MTTRFQLPPIVKASERLLVDIEQAVRGFDRYHRYQIGADLRRHAAEVYRIANRAGRDVNQRHELVPQLVWAVDEVKQTMQIAKLLHAFKSFRQFAAIARQAEDVGKQAGGWRKLLQHPKAQDAQARSVLASYDGHFQHANTHRLRKTLQARFPWTKEITA